MDGWRALLVCGGRRVHLRAPSRRA